ncbi:unnamed protein product [Rotaria sordida]|uniref:Methyltransferase FkbM domain-containing protein n=1 Tax=Rotaria sordida TaxID=392033 RepID=A0A815MQ31_9BILA|nr:unnamed protein product [Rotaria sordida]
MDSDQENDESGLFFDEEDDSDYENKSDIELDEEEGEDDKYRTTVCVHEIQKDRDVNGHLVSHGIWEEHLVTRFIRILSTYKQYSFIDIGANLGIYRMYAASLGCSNIISIECFRPNIERIRR